MDAIYQTLLTPDRRYSERNHSSDGRHIGTSTIYQARLTCTVVDGYHSPTRTNKYIDVRVVVNPRTNNVITAYILDHQIDANPKLLGGCGP